MCVVRQTLRHSIYISFLLLEIEILIEKYSPTASLSGYPNVAIIHFLFSIPYFLLAKDR